MKAKTLNEIKGDEVIKKLHNLLTKSTETTCLSQVSSSDGIKSKEVSAILRFQVHASSLVIIFIRISHIQLGLLYTLTMK